jgi:hypothetical protein
MNVHYITKADSDILAAAIEDARNFFAREALTLWDLCDCIDDTGAREAVGDLVGFFDEPSPTVRPIIDAINKIVFALMSVPFELVDILESETRFEGGLDNAIRIYGPRLADISNRLSAGAQAG